MNADEAITFIYMVNRRREALHLKKTQPQVFQRYMKQYHKINEYLKAQYRWYAIYWITNGKDRMPEEYMAAIGLGYPHIWKKVTEGLQEGNIQKMNRYLQVLRNIYVSMRLADRTRV